MKAIYFTKVDAALKDAVPARLSGFEHTAVRLTKEQKAISRAQNGDRIFIKKYNEDLWLFLVFRPDSEQEDLLLDIGWSAKKRYPFDLDRPSGSLAPGRGEFEHEEAFFEFNQIYFREFHRNHHGWPVWRCTVDPLDPSYRAVFVQEVTLPISEHQAQARAQQAVAQSISDIHAIVLPYFEELVRHKTNRV